MRPSYGSEAAMTMTPAYEAWLRACAEYLADNRPYLALYDVDPGALRSAFAIGTVPTELLSLDHVPLATSRDPNLLSFFREDVRRALAISRPDLDLQDIATAAIDEAYSSGASATGFANEAGRAILKGSRPNGTSDASSQAQTTRPRSRLLAWAVVGSAILILVAILFMYRSPSQANPNSQGVATSAINATAGNAAAATAGNEAGQSGQDQEGNGSTQEVAGSAPVTNPQTQEVAKDPGAALNPAGAAGPMQGSPTNGTKPTAAPQVSVSSTPALPKPSIDAFYATYSATGDDSNPWRMTLHWKTRNVDSVELSYGSSRDTGLDTPDGEVTFDHGPDGSGPIRPGQTYMLRGFNGDQVSTRAVTADPPP